MTVVAGSIGIICVCLVLGLSSGLTAYINAMGEEMLGTNPMIISSVSVDFSPVLTGKVTFEDMFGEAKYPDDGIISGEQSNLVSVMLDMIQTNTIDDKLVNYVKDEIQPVSDAVIYDYGYTPLLLSKVSKDYKPSSGIGGALTGGADFNLNGGDIGKISDLVTFQPCVAEKYYESLAGRLPENKNEVVLVVSGSNTVSEGLMASIGHYRDKISAQELVDEGITIKMVLNDLKYVKGAGERYSEIANSDGKQYAELYNMDSNDVVDLKIVGVLRPKKGTVITAMNSGIAYHPSLMDYVHEQESDSRIVADQAASPKKDVITGEALYGSILEYVFDKASGFTNIYGSEVMEIITDFYSGLYPIHKLHMASLGGSDLPVNINIYTMSYDTKNEVVAKIEAYNALLAQQTPARKVSYTDPAAMMTAMLSNIVDVLSIVLICFTSVSLIVSSVMIGIITYISVVERTKEIGILRSLGARKSDVARVFIAESLMIGLAAGVLGIVVAYLISLPLNFGLATLTAGFSICTLLPWHAAIMVGVSVLLTVLAGSIPSYIASKRDPVVALRSE